MINHEVISTPTMLLDRERCLRNLHLMVQRASANEVELRPHFKTHQSAQIATWFAEAGVRKITVSSVTMAKYFADHGWDDITIAFPVNTLESGELVKLSRRISLNVIISSFDSLGPLLKVPGNQIGVFIKLDVGTNRTGFDPNSTDIIRSIIDRLAVNANFIFRGFLFHTGHTYACNSKVEVNQIHREALESVRSLVQHYKREIPSVIVSAGDTPACSIASEWSGVDEIRPGNFIFYDLTQWQIGSCSLDQIAVALACPVVAKHPERQSIILYGGGVHLSKDRLQWDDKVIYGLPVKLTAVGWQLPDLRSYVSGLSQEHGIVQASKELFASTEVGDLLGILPVHSCMACNLMQSYTLTDSHARISMMPSTSINS